MNYANKVLIKATKKLEDYSTSASLDAEVLLMHVLKIDKTQLLANPKLKISFINNIKFNSLINKRIKYYPIAYLIGYKEFYGLKFKVNKHTLVPRPESELFIDELKKINPINKIIIDIGTGSGCLIISAAKYLPNNKYIGTDISSDALKIAKLNAKAYNLNIDFYKGNLLELVIDRNINIIMANLPYLNETEMKENSIKREPRTALYSKDNGLYHYNRLLQQIKENNLKPEYIFIEINPEQIKTLSLLINKLLPKYNITKIKDLSNSTRLLKLSLTNTF
ncbi:MAG: peptide chain release factor N(5)-glutamine methyltransferase [Candidatus Komeilibacteria bacterium]